MTKAYLSEKDTNVIVSDILMKTFERNKVINFYFHIIVGKILKYLISKVIGHGVKTRINAYVTLIQRP